MIELFIGGAMIAVVIFLLGGRRSDPDSRSFVPDDKVAPDGNDDCPDMTCIAYRRRMGLTGRYAQGTPDAIPTVTGRISQAYPSRLTSQPQPAPRVQPQPARLPAPKPQLPPGVTEVPTEVFYKGEWIRVDDLAPRRR